MTTIYKGISVPDLTDPPNAPQQFRTLVDTGGAVPRFATMAEAEAAFPPGATRPDGMIVSIGGVFYWTEAGSFITTGRGGPGGQLLVYAISVGADFGIGTGDTASLGDLANKQFVLTERRYIRMETKFMCFSPSAGARILQRVRYRVGGGTVTTSDPTIAYDRLIIQGGGSNALETMHCFGVRPLDAGTYTCSTFTAATEAFTLVRTADSPQLIATDLGPAPAP